MKNLLLTTLALSVLAVSQPAFAHSMVKSSNIEVGQIYSASPSNFDIIFAHQVGLAAVTIETPLGEVIDIDFKAPKGMGDTFSIPLPALDEGDYILNWRAIAKDGHVMSDKIDFSIGASEGHTADKHDMAKQVPASLPGSPESAVDAFGEALRSGDTATIEDMMLADVFIAEGGGAERSFAEYAGHHMPADIAFTAAMETTLKSRKTVNGPDMAIVISESEMHGMYKEKDVHSKMMETIALKKIDGQWKIAHIHWSSAKL